METASLTSQVTFMIYQLIALIGAFSISVLMTPVFQRLSIRLGIVDHPDAHRKLHREPIALCGGPTLLLSTFIATCTLPLLHEETRLWLFEDPWPFLGIFGGAFAIACLGMIDDRFALRGRQKLMGQIVIAFGMTCAGFIVSNIEILGVNIELGLIAIPVSILWFLVTINSLNLIDGADGLCSSVGWIASAGIAAMATLGGRTFEGCVAAGLAGSLLGFLVYNFPPARVFLGDAGSMLVGLVLGALALKASLKGATSISLLGPVAIFAIPLFDSSMAIIRRKLTGRSIFSTDRGHIHHSLLRWGLSHRGLVVAINVICAVTAMGALVGTILNNQAIALLSTLVVLGCLVASRAFGYAEMRLLSNRVYHFCGSLIPRGTTNINRGQHHTIRFQGNRSWETIWHSLMEFAEKHDLAKISLDLNVPWLHEGYHANWNRSRMPEDPYLWRSQLPIFSGNRSLGRLSLVGKMEGMNSVSLLSELAEMIEGLQSEIASLAFEATNTDPIQISTDLDDSSPSLPVSDLSTSNLDSDPNLALHLSSVPLANNNKLPASL